MTTPVQAIEALTAGVADAYLPAPPVRACADGAYRLSRRHRHGCRHQIVREYSTIRPVTSFR